MPRALCQPTASVTIEGPELFDVAVRRSTGPISNLVGPGFEYESDLPSLAPLEARGLAVPTGTYAC